MYVMCGLLSYTLYKAKQRIHTYSRTPIDFTLRLAPLIDWQDLAARRGRQRQKNAFGRAQVRSGEVSQEDDDDGHVVGGAAVESLAEQPLSDHVWRLGGVAAAVDDARIVKHLDGHTQ